MRSCSLSATPRLYAAAIKAAGCKLICQVQGLEEARLAQEAGADIVVAQATEGGGHGGGRATLPLVPAVVDAVAPTPVVAAGGTPTAAAWRPPSC